jgi:hypothetical protein
MERLQVLDYVSYSFLHFFFFFTIIFSHNRSVPAFTTKLINLFKEEVPDFYEKCEAAET